MGDYSIFFNKVDTLSLSFKQLISKETIIDDTSNKIIRESIPLLLELIISDRNDFTLNELVCDNNCKKLNLKKLSLEYDPDDDKSKVILENHGKQIQEEINIITKNLNRRRNVIEQEDSLLNILTKNLCNVSKLSTKEKENLLDSSKNIFGNGLGIKISEEFLEKEKLDMYISNWKKNPDCHKLIFCVFRYYYQSKEKETNPKTTSKNFSIFSSDN